MSSMNTTVHTALRTIGWVSLVLGAALAITIWITIGTMKSTYGYSKEPNPIGIAIGFATLFQSVIVCVLFNALAVIVETLIETKNIQEKQIELFL